MMLVWESAGELRLALTRRSIDLRANPGDVALPGGRSDPGEQPHETATREAAEEIGVDPARIEIMGRFDDAWSGARFLVVPVVGWHDGPPRLEPQLGEVDAIYEVALADLADPANRGERVAQVGSHVYTDATLSVAGVEVVGLTADLLDDLTTWMSGRDRRRGPQRRAALEDFATRNGWR